jgi:membrane protease YdiL (CAAX protease family)
MKSSLLHTFLGISRLRALFSTLRVLPPPEALLSTGVVTCAVLMSAVPLLAAYLDTVMPGRDLTTIYLGITACFAILFRHRIGLSFRSVRAWRSSLSLVHTSVALGCIPAVFIVLFHPDALYTLQQQTSSGPQRSLLLSLAAIAVWAGLTEEILFRGLLVSVVRRWRVPKNAFLRDAVAVSLSAVIFGAAHVPRWGVPMSIALVGIGAGFAVAYLATEERLLPVVVYHTGFNFLSLLAAVLFRGAQ